MLRRARISVKPNVRPGTGRAGVEDRGGQGAQGAGEAPETTSASTSRGTSRTPRRAAETDSEPRLLEESTAAAATAASVSSTASLVASAAEAVASAAANAPSDIVESAVGSDSPIPLAADLVASADKAAAADVVTTPDTSVHTAAGGFACTAHPLTHSTAAAPSSHAAVSVPPRLATAAAASPDLAASALSNLATQSSPLSAHTVAAPAAFTAAHWQQHATVADELMHLGADSSSGFPTAGSFEEVTILPTAARHDASANATTAADVAPPRPGATAKLPASRRKRLSTVPIIPRGRAAAQGLIAGGPVKKTQTAPPPVSGTASKRTTGAIVDGPCDLVGSPASKTSLAAPVKLPASKTPSSSVGPSGADVVQAVGVDQAQEVLEKLPQMPDRCVTDGETVGLVPVAQLGVSTLEPTSRTTKCIPTAITDFKTLPVVQSAELYGATRSSAALPSKPAEPSRSEISKKLLASLKKSLLKTPALSVKATLVGADVDNDDDDSGTAVVAARGGSAQSGTAGGVVRGGSGANAGRTQPRPNFKKSSRTVQKTARELAEKTEAKKAARKLAWRTWEQHQSAPDRSQMTMKDLLYWVPRNNPMLRLKSEDGKLLPEKRFDKYSKGERSVAQGTVANGDPLEPILPDVPTSPLVPLPDCLDNAAPPLSPAAADPTPPPNNPAAAPASTVSTSSVSAVSTSPVDVPLAVAAPSLSPADDAQSLLVPQVRVAEDGSIVLNEDSLMVEVSRTEGLPPVSDCDPIHEYGSHTTYSSFRKSYHAKQWGLLETELFFLAISMVGMDFSMIGQLFPNRSRVDIKNKFKREERCNPRKIDQAFPQREGIDLEDKTAVIQETAVTGNKLPLDVSCFETLLEEFERQKAEVLNRAPDSKGRGRRKYRPKRMHRRRSDVDSDAECWSESGGESGAGAAVEDQMRTTAHGGMERAAGMADAAEIGTGTEVQTGTVTETRTRTVTQETGESSPVVEPPPVLLPVPPAPSGLEEAELLLSLGCEVARGYVAGAGEGEATGVASPAPSPDLMPESAERQHGDSGDANGEDDVNDEEDFELVKERMLSHPTRSGRRPKPTAFYSNVSTGAGGGDVPKEGAAKRPRRREADPHAAPTTHAAQRPRPKPGSRGRRLPTRPPRRDATDTAPVLATRGRGGLVTLRAIAPPEEEEDGVAHGAGERHRRAGNSAAAAAPLNPVRPEHLSCAPAFVPVCLRSPEPKPLTEHMEEQVELSEADAMLEAMVVTCVEEMVVADEELEEVVEESVDPDSDECRLPVEQNCGVVITDEEHMQVNEAFVYEVMEQAGFSSIPDAYGSSQEGRGGDGTPTMLCFVVCEDEDAGTAFPLSGDGGDAAAVAVPEVPHLSLAPAADEQDDQRTSAETSADVESLQNNNPLHEWEEAELAHLWAAQRAAPSTELFSPPDLGVDSSTAERSAVDVTLSPLEASDALSTEAPSETSDDLLTLELGRDSIEEEKEQGDADAVVMTQRPSSVTADVVGSGAAVDDDDQTDLVQPAATVCTGDAGTAPRSKRPCSDIADGAPAKKHSVEISLSPLETPDVPSSEFASTSDDLQTPKLGYSASEQGAAVAELDKATVLTAPSDLTKAAADDGQPDLARPPLVASAGATEKNDVPGAAPPARRTRFAKPRPNLITCSARRASGLTSGPTGASKPAQVGSLGAVK